MCQILYYFHCQNLAPSVRLKTQDHLFGNGIIYNPRLANEKHQRAKIHHSHAPVPLNHSKSAYRIMRRLEHTDRIIYQLFTHSYIVSSSTTDPPTTPFFRDPIVELCEEHEYPFGSSNSTLCTTFLSLFTTQNCGTPGGSKLKPSPISFSAYLTISASGECTDPVGGNYVLGPLLTVSSHIIFFRNQATTSHDFTVRCITSNFLIFINFNSLWPNRNANKIIALSTSSFQ